MRPSDLDEEAHDDETATLLMQQRTELALVPTKIEKDINESIAKARAGQPRTNPFADVSKPSAKRPRRLIPAMVPTPPVELLWTHTKHHFSHTYLSLWGCVMC